MSLPKLKRIIVALAALVALALPATALASYLVPGKAGVVLRKGPGCTAQCSTSGPYTGQGLERCPAGKLRAYPVVGVRLLGARHAQLLRADQLRACDQAELRRSQPRHRRFGSYYHGCSVRVRGVTFTR